MSFGQNLQFLRKMRRSMTQEELAEKMRVSRQTISKWELDAAYPEMDKVIELCQYFSCSMDQLMREDMNVCGEAYSDIRVECIGPLRYVRYAVISMEPEEDALTHVKGWAARCGVEQPEIIGWDFPVLSQEQINVYHMHGYAAAWILPKNLQLEEERADIVLQQSQKYAVITIREPFSAPFSLIPNAYKTLMSYMQVNGIRHKEDKACLPCYEKTYEKDGICYMDVLIAADL